MWVGLLIFYVTNETNETNENKCAFCRILRQKHRILPYFAAAFSAQKPYLCTEFQSALKLQTNNQARIPTKFLSRTQIQRKRMGNYMKIICSKQIHRNA